MTQQKKKLSASEQPEYSSPESLKLESVPHFGDHTANIHYKIFSNVQLVSQSFFCLQIFLRNLICFSSVFNACFIYRPFHRC
jgi:hypothetical protein